MDFLGTIAVPSSGVSVNNTNTTGTPFAINSIYRYLLIKTPNDVAGFNVIVATGSSLTSNANQYNVAASSQKQIACPPPSANATVIAIYCSGATGGNVSVYGLYGEAVSPAAGASVTLTQTITASLPNNAPQQFRAIYLTTQGSISNVQITAQPIYMATRAVKLANLYAALGAAPGVGTSIVCNVYKSSDYGNTWAPTALTATISGAGQTASDTTHTVSLAVNDMFCFEIDATGAATSANSPTMSCDVQG